MTTKRIKKVITTTISFDVILYLTIGIMGYLTDPISTPDLIIERYKLLDSDIILAIGRVLFVVTVTAKIPTAYNSFRLSILELAYKTTEVSTIRYIIRNYYKLGII